MEFKPGDTVPQNGIYRVDHESHRVMHEARLMAETRFPRCRHCKNEVRFHLLQPFVDDSVVARGAHVLLEEFTEPEPPLAAA